MPSYTASLDAIVLAAAGVKRLNLETCITEYLDEDIMLPAVGQGALCIEIRNDDPEIGPLVETLDHHQTRTVVTAERAFLNRLGGSCQVPVAGHAVYDATQLTLKGIVAELDGSNIIGGSVTGTPESCEAIGLKLAEQLLSMGADKILDKLKSMELDNHAG